MKTHKLTVALAVLLFAACQKDELQSKQDKAVTSASVKDMITENGSNPDEAMLNANSPSYYKGHFYMQSNDATENAVLMFNVGTDGKLTLAGTFTDGEKGAGKGLGSQGSVVMDAYHKWLFVVNAGSNSVSSFKINDDGSLAWKDTRGSGGKFPVSLCSYDNFLYVVNSESARINGYSVESNGNLKELPYSKHNLSAKNALPAQIAFDPTGKTIVVTEKMTNIVATYKVKPDGNTSDGIFTSSVGIEPFGFSFARNYMITTNASFGGFDASTVTSYKNLPHPEAVNGAVPNYQTATCWAATTKYGRFVFVTNAMSNSISSYYITNDGSLYYLAWSVIPTGLNPNDLCFSGDYKYLYSVNATAHTISEFKRQPYGTLENIGTVASIPPFATGAAAY